MAAMVEHSALESLVQRLGSLNESNDDEAEAVSNTLAIFENIVELAPQVCPSCRTSLCRWGTWSGGCCQLTSQQKAAA